MELTRHALSQLLDLPVVDVRGRRLGRLWDLRAEYAVDGGPRVRALQVGRRALLHRLAGGARGSQEIPWEQVVAIEPRQIVVREQQAG